MTQSPQPLGARLLKGIRCFVGHPFGQFVLLIVFLYQVKECYPFTHIPMYSDPENNAPYLHLEDAEGNPIGVKSHSGVTNPKMRKMYRKRLEIYCEEKGLDRKNPPQEAIDAVGEDVIAFLRQRSLVRKNPLPDTVRLMHVLIEPAPAPDGYKETTTLLTQSGPTGGSGADDAPSR